MRAKEREGRHRETLVPMRTFSEERKDAGQPANVESFIAHYWSALLIQEINT